MIEQLGSNPQSAPPGWSGLIDDEDDHDHPEARPEPDKSTRPRAKNGPESGSPADFGALIAGDTEKWEKVIKFASIRPE
jgi:hypothetical protein